MEILSLPWLGTPLWMWLSFLAIVATLLVIDLGVLHRKEREIGVRESLAISAFYIALGLGFGAWVWWYMGATAGMNYVTGFVIEKSLAMDNVFVIAMIFGYFAVPRLYQHRVLFWGILGVIVLRDHDWLRRRRGAGVELGALRLRRLPDTHGNQDVVDR